MPFYHQTVSQTKFGINKHLELQTRKEMEKCKYSSVPVDKSLFPVFLCLRTIDDIYSDKKDILYYYLFTLMPLVKSTQGHVFTCELFWWIQKCSCLSTDGAKWTTCSSSTGLLHVLRRNCVQAPLLHYVIHQELLWGKFLKYSLFVKESQ
jgi:hypothetical protein